MEVVDQQPARLIVRREKPALIVNEESLVPKGYYAGVDSDSQNNYFHVCLHFSTVPNLHVWGQAII